MTISVIKQAVIQKFINNPLISAVYSTEDGETFVYFGEAATHKRLQQLNGPIKEWYHEKNSHGEIIIMFVEIEE